MASLLTQIVGVGSATVLTNQQQVTPAQSAQASGAAGSEAKTRVDTAAKKNAGTIRDAGAKKQVQTKDGRVESAFTPKQPRKNGLSEEDKDKDEQEGGKHIDTVA